MNQEPVDSLILCESLFLTPSESSPFSALPSCSNKKFALSRGKIKMNMLIFSKTKKNPRSIYTLIAVDARIKTSGVDHILMHLNKSRMKRQN